MSNEKTDYKSIQDELDTQLEGLFGEDGEIQLDDDLEPGTDLDLSVDDTPEELGGIEARHLDVDMVEDIDLDLNLGDDDITSAGGNVVEDDMELELELDEDDILSATSDDTLSMDDLGLELDEDVSEDLGDQLADILELTDDVVVPDVGAETVVIEPEEMELILEESDSPVDTPAVNLTEPDVDIDSLVQLDLEPDEEEPTRTFEPLSYIGPEDVDDDVTDAFTITVVKNKATERYHLQYGDNDYGKDSWATFEGALGALVGELTVWMAPYQKALESA